MRARNTIPRLFLLEMVDRSQDPASVPSEIPGMLGRGPVQGSLTGTERRNERSGSRPGRSGQWNQNLEGLPHADRLFEAVQPQDHRLADFLSFRSQQHVGAG